MERNIMRLQEEMKEITDLLFNWNYIDTTGGSLSARIDNEYFALTPTHSGFKRWKLNEGLLVLDHKCNLHDEFATSNIKAHPSAILHAAVYEHFPLANAIIHTHSPYSLVYASAGKDIKPYTQQSQILGDVPCFKTIYPENSSKTTINEKEKNLGSALFGYEYSLNHFEPLISQIIEVLGKRSGELKRHGLVFTVYKHGIFVIARTLSEAFDNLIRIERNAQVQLLSNNLLSNSTFAG